VVKVPDSPHRRWQRDYHDQRGGYGKAPVERLNTQQPNGKTVETLLGLSRPSVAFTPKGPFDVGFVPYWFGQDGDDPTNFNPFASMALTPHAQQLTVIPNVTDVDGYVKALEMIASPERMNMARMAGANRMQEIKENKSAWKSTGHPLGYY